MTSREVRVEETYGIATVAVNRSQRCNGITTRMLTELHDRLRTIASGNMHVAATLSLRQHFADFLTSRHKKSSDQT